MLTWYTMWLIHAVPQATRCDLRQPKSLRECAPQTPLCGNGYTSRAELGVWRYENSIYWDAYYTSNKFYIYGFVWEKCKFPLYTLIIHKLVHNQCNQQVQLYFMNTCTRTCILWIHVLIGVCITADYTLTIQFISLTFIWESVHSLFRDGASMLMVCTCT